MRRRTAEKKIVYRGCEWDCNSPVAQNLLPHHGDLTPFSSVTEGCFRVVSCPQCARRVYTEINIDCKCACGKRFFVDYDGVVTEIEGEIDRDPVPDLIKEYLLPDEIACRIKQYTDDVSEITKLCKPLNVCGRPSIRKVLEVRNKRKEDTSEMNLGGLIQVLLFFVGAFTSIILCLDGVFWPIVAFVVIAGYFLRTNRNEFKANCDAWSKDDARIEGVMRALYMHEAERLRDNLLAKGRWEERKKNEEESRRQKELKLQEEQEWIHKQRETEEGIVKAICLGKIRFAEFVSGVNPGDGHGYEKRVKKFIELCGFECQLVADSADQGVDLIIHDGAVKAAIQCKYYSDCNAGIDAVQQVHTGARYYSCESSAVLTNNGFTKSATEVANKVGVALVPQEELVSFLEGLPSGKKKIDRLTDRDILIPETLDSAFVDQYKTMMRAVIDA